MDSSVLRGFAPKGSASSSSGCLVSPAGALIPGFARISIFSSPLPAPYGNHWTSGYRPNDQTGKDFLMGSAILGPVMATASPSTSNRNKYPDQLFWIYGTWFDPLNAGNYRGTQTWQTAYPTSTSPGFGAFSQFQEASSVADVPTPITGTDYRRIRGYMTTGYGAQWDGGTSTWRTVPPEDDTNPTWMVTSALSATGFATNRLIYPDPDWTAPLTSDNPVIGSIFGGDFACYHQGRLVVGGQGGYSLYGSSHIFEGSTFSNDLAYGGYLEMGDKAPAPAGRRNMIFVDSMIAKAAAMCSVNANTLFVQMDTSGGYVYTGDLDRPQVTHLAGIPSAFGAAAIPTTTTKGVFFTSRRGLHLWGGGTDAQLASPNLPGEFWMNSDWQKQRTHSASKGKLNYSEPYVFLPNDWIVDTRNGSMWKLARPTSFSDPTVNAAPFFHYEMGSTGALYALPEYLDQGASVASVQYDPSIMGNNGHVWTWTSNPIPELSATGRAVIVREVELVVSGSGSVLLNVNAGLQSYGGTITFNTALNPTKIRVQLAVKSKNDGTPTGLPSSDSFTYSFTCTGNNTQTPAPIIHAVRIGYIFDASVPTA